MEKKIKPFLSFIIPCYNTPYSMLSECLDSILSLSLKADEREIILVDDGSDVPVISLLSDYVGDIIYVRKENEGPSAARNRGIALAKGSYIQFVDSDDYLLKESYEHCLSLLRHERPELLMFDSLRNDIAYRSIYHESAVVTGCEYMSMHNICVTVWGYIFKANLLKDLRFPEGLIHEDEEFTTLLLLKVQHMIKTDAQAYVYRHRENSITTANDKRMVLKRLNDKESILLKLDVLSQSLSGVEEQVMRKRVAQLTMDYLYNIMVTTRSWHQLQTRLFRLHEEGLFPLPDKAYTCKYKWFRRILGFSIGRFVMLWFLPRRH